MTKMATRDAYGKSLAEFGSDERIVVLDADLSKSTKTAVFQNIYPERHFNMGIAEANMMGVAAGMATCGKIAFASTFAIFASQRALEQVRNSICYPNLNVKVCATHAGLTVGEDGASHQSVEDLAIMRVIPNMHVVCPCDGAQTRQAIRAAIDTDGPFFVRLGRPSVEPVYGEFDADAPFELGKANVLNEGTDVALIATGLMVQESQKAARLLEAEGLSVMVLDIHTLKPIDEAAIIRTSQMTGAIVTVEEHSIIGGLGGAVAEVLAENAPCHLKRVGVRDVFGQSGKPAELLKLYNLTPEDIANAAREIIAKKDA